ncbi:Protein TIC 56, chloroplastic [Dionaea muscipula]
MASINFGPFADWFNKPPNPNSPFHLLPPVPFQLSTNSNPRNFASLSISNPFAPKPKKEKPRPPRKQRRKNKEMLKQYFWECETRPDYRHTPEVEKILKEDPIWENKENPTAEEVEENQRWWEEFRDSPVANFLARAEEVADDVNEMLLKENEKPHMREDRKIWKEVPHVIGLDGRPMPRRAIKSIKESGDKFWEFCRQFFFGLWGFRSRPYPPGRPIDVAQAIGYKQLDNRYYDFIMKTGGFFYKDRLGRSRGPCELIQLKTAWAGGIIDKHTFIWGEDMDEWAPIGMVYGMERAIATWEVRLGAAATAFIHKLEKGIPPWVPLRGHEKKTYKQLQEEAIESKNRDLAVLKANDGIWPGVRIPSHALFLWASGSELTTILESDHMPNRYIPKRAREELAKVIPRLRPWEVLSVEQAMDELVFGGKWHRDLLGSFTTGPPYIREWNREIMRLVFVVRFFVETLHIHLGEAIPGFDRAMRIANTLYFRRDERWRKERIRRRNKERNRQIKELKEDEGEW